MKALVTLLFLIACGSTSAAECDQLVPYGIPSVPGAKSTQICRTAYVVKYFDDCKVPFFVAEHLKGENVGGTEPRITFRPDLSLPVEIRATNGDYTRSGYDKGHLAPAADFHDDHDAMSESFILSNALPQTKKLNRGVWKSIEMRTRALAVKHDDVYIFSGGIFGAKPEKIGNGVCVPIQTYKVVINKKTHQSIGYITPNDHEVKGKAKSFQVPVSQIEQATGINFTPLLEETAAKTLKKSIGKDLTAR